MQNQVSYQHNWPGLLGSHLELDHSGTLANHTVVFTNHCDVSFQPSGNFINHFQLSENLYQPLRYPFQPSENLYQPLWYSFPTIRETFKKFYILFQPSQDFIRPCDKSVKTIREHLLTTLIYLFNHPGTSANHCIISIQPSGTHDHPFLYPFPTIREPLPIVRMSFPYYIFGPSYNHDHNLGYPSAPSRTFTNQCDFRLQPSSTFTNHSKISLQQQKP